MFKIHFLKSHWQAHPSKNDFYNFFHAITLDVAVVACTTDGWTSRAVEGYLSFTIHYTNSKFEPKSRALNLRKIDKSHTAENLLEALQEIMAEWGLLEHPRMKFIWTTDSAANMIKTVQLGDWERIPCIGHKLALTVADTVNTHLNIRNVVTKCSKIVAHFAHSVKSRNLFKKKQEEQLPNEKSLSLIQKNLTRWNTIYDMFQRIYELREALSATLLDPDFQGTVKQLKDSDWKIIRAYLAVFGMAKDATVLLSGSRYPTLSQYLPTYFALTSRADFLSRNSSNSHAKQYATSFGKFLEQRFGDLLKNKSLILSMLIDPRFKRTFLESPEDKEFAVNLMEEAMSEKMVPGGADNQSNAEKNDEEEEIQNPGEEKNTLLLFFEKARQKSLKNIEDQNTGLTVKVELTRYLNEQTVDRRTNIFEWWQKNQTNYFLVSKVAMDYLNIPATQVDSERLFSLAGNIITVDRPQLLSENVEMMAFLHGNST